MLRLPVRARCDDRSRLAITHPSSGEPHDWLKPSILQAYDLIGISFGFFVDWRNRSIPDAVWVKRIVQEDCTPWPLTDAIRLQQAIREIDTEGVINALIRFCAKHALRCHYFMFKESTPWSFNPRTIVELEITSVSPQAMLTDVSSIRERIRTLRGRRVPIGPGGLIYGDSSLECFLSHTPDFWPGDVDMLLVDSRSLVHAVLEFKKHTLASPIDGQTVLRYRDRDRLKYESIGFLRDHFAGSKQLPVLMVYYPTNPSHRVVKLERLVGPANALKPSISEVLPLPMLNDRHSLRRFSDALIRMMSA